MKLCTLSSGSKGNCLYVESGSGALLIDQGLALRELERRAASIGLNLSKVRGIAVTHEHSDHIKGVEAFCNKYGVKAFISPVSAAAAGANMKVRSVIETSSFDLGCVIADMKVSPFRLPHDAAYTVGYEITDGKTTLCSATDLGFVIEATGKRLARADAVVLESNHDLAMLRSGRYPPALKARIESNTGHLSNDRAAEVACKLVTMGVRRIILAHLSQDNNRPDIAYNATVGAMTASHIVQGRDAVVDVAHQFEPSLLTEI